MKNAMVFQVLPLAGLLYNYLFLIIFLNEFLSASAGVRVGV
jgi:hypothetical protein